MGFSPCRALSSNFPRASEFFRSLFCRFVSLSVVDDSVFILVMPQKATYPGIEILDLDSSHHGHSTKGYKVLFDVSGGISGTLIRKALFANAYEEFRATKWKTQ